MHTGRYCFLNGQIIPENEATVSVFDIGLLRGTGVYEALPAFSGTLFRFADHWERLLNSAHFLNLNIPVTEEKAEKIITELLEKNGFSDKRANVKFILTGGKATSSLEYNFETPTFLIFTELQTPVPEQIYESGAKLITYNYLRDLPNIKTINYANAVNLQNWRKEEQAIEILYTHDGEISECSTSNIFLVKNGTLLTPSENVLKGITRKVVLEIAHTFNIPVEERPVLESELLSADEVCITSSFKDIVPIVTIDDAQIADSIPGSITKQLMEEFKKLI